jgi:hypothetical protein
VYYIKSIGIAIPETNLDNSALVALGLDIDKNIAINNRSIILSSDYLASTRNNNFTLARSNSYINTANLAKQSFERAIVEAKIQSTDVGLLWADTLTPWQLTPSEAQRIGCELGLKISSYDVATSGLGLPLLLNTLNNLDESQNPDVIAISIVNALSLYIDYSKKSLIPQILSDSAVTLICTKEPVGYELLLSMVKTENLEHAPFTVSTVRHCNEMSDLTVSALSEFCKKRFLELWPSFSKLSTSGQISLAVSDFGTNFLKEALVANDLENINLVPVTSKYGESINCAAGIGLYEWSKTASSNDIFIGFNPGLGQQYGMFAVRKI